MDITISKGNTKLGDIYNVSLAPVRSCPVGVPCSQRCYAMKAYRLYPTVKEAWDKNLTVYLMDPDDYFEQLDHFLKTVQPRFFRWHVAGDIVDDYYFANMVILAVKHEFCEFLAFTKNFDVVMQYEYQLPNNLTVMFSSWPGLEVPESDFKISYTVEKESDIPEGVFVCNRQCDDCYQCWGTEIDVWEKLK